MRKITTLAVVLALAGLLTSPPAQAEESGMLEISGNIVSVTAWQRGMQGRFVDTTAGILGDGLRVPVVAGREQFGFFIDQIELDVAKSFGENIRFRTDLDFNPFNGGATPGRLTPAAGLTGNGDVLVEQAYVTANIPAGNGWELLVGRFNSGIGLDPIDRNELTTISYSSNHRLLLPWSMTGARVGYDWSDNFRWETFIVNDLQDGPPAIATGNSNMPSFGINAIYKWGDEGNMSWFKFSGAGGPEDTVAISNKHWTFLGDMAVRYAWSDAFAVGVEGVYRQDNAGAAATDNNQYFGGTLQGTYNFSDVWDGTFRYGYLFDLDAGSGGANARDANPISNVGIGGVLTNGAVRHDIALATGYAITDGCRLAFEGRFDLSNPSSAADGSTGIHYGFGGMFAYNF